MDAKWYALGAAAGLLAIAVLSPSGHRYTPAVTTPKQLVTLPPLLATASAGELSLPGAMMPRGVPPELTAAMLKAPSGGMPDKSVEIQGDTVLLTLGPDTARTMALACVDAINAAGSLNVHLIQADDALAMASGATRVIFTVHEPTKNVSLKFVATFVDNQLRLVRPYSLLPTPTESPFDMGPASSYATFAPP